ncbi:50S ribosomal protein L25 [bacterium]|nr:50S ribosomal protein L25 [bacterium]
MLSLSAKIRNIFGKKTRVLREKGILPGIVYGPNLKNIPLELDLKEFEKVYKEAGESSLISLEVEGKKEKNLVLIREVKLDPLTDKPIHVDFYQPNLEEKIEVTVPLVFKGEAPAVKELGGTLVKNISEIEVKVLPQNIPHEIEVNVEKLKTFDDAILVRDLRLPEGVEILRESQDTIAFVAEPEKVEEELEKPIEEKVEEVEKVKEEKEEKEEVSSEG